MRKVSSPFVLIASKCIYDYYYVFIHNSHLRTLNTRMETRTHIDVHVAPFLRSKIEVFSSLASFWSSFIFNFYSFSTFIYCSQSTLNSFVRFRIQFVLHTYVGFQPRVWHRSSDTANEVMSLLFIKSKWKSVCSINFETWWRRAGGKSMAKKNANLNCGKMDSSTLARSFAPTQSRTHTHTTSPPTTTKH